MTDAEQAARIAAIRAKRGQAPAAVTPARPAPLPPPTLDTAVVEVIPAPTPGPAATPAPAAARTATRPVAPTARTTPPARRGRRPHIAAGARSLVTGLTGSAIFGLTTLIAAANVPAAATNPAPAIDDAAPSTVVVPVSIVPTDAGAPAVPASGNGAASQTPGVETVVLTLPTLATTNTVAGGNAPAVVNSSGGSAPVTTSAPRPATPAPTTTVAAPVTTTAPPPPPTTTAPSK